MPKLNLRDVEDILNEEQEDSNEFMDDPEYEGLDYSYEELNEDIEWLDRTNYLHDNYQSNTAALEVVDNNHRTTQSLKDDYAWAFDWEDQDDLFPQDAIDQFHKD